jgi:hypothetical protein
VLCAENFYGLQEQKEGEWVNQIEKECSSSSLTIIGICGDSAFPRFPPPLGQKKK